MIDAITKFLIEYPSKEFDGPYYIEELRELATKLWEQVIQPEMKKDYVLLDVNGITWNVERTSLESLMASFLAVKGSLNRKEIS